MSVIAYRFKGQEMDAQVLERFLLNNTIVGMASVHAEAGKEPFVATIRTPLKNIKGSQLDGVQKLLNRWKDRDVLMYFVNAEDGVKAVQPFDILFNTDNRASCVAFCLNLKDNEQITKYLMPAVTKLLPKDGDLDVLFKEMQEETFGAGLSKMYVEEEGVTVFLCANGESLVIGEEGVTGEDREWGWATHYYEEETAEGTGDESDEALKELIGDDDAQKELPIEPAPQTKPATTKTSSFKAPGGKPVVETKKLDTVGSKVEIEYEKFIPKAGMREREFDQLMLKHMDVVPKTAFAEYTKGKFFVMIPKTAMAKAMTAAVDRKGADPRGVQQQQKPAEEHKGLKRLDELPIMSDETRQEITTILKDPKHAEFMDKDKAKIIDPNAYKDYDKKLASFAEQLGIADIGITLNWPHSLRVKIGEAENGAEALACLCTWLSYELKMLRDKQTHEDEAAGGEAGAIPDTVETKPPEVKKKSGFKPPQGMRKAG